MDLDGTETAPAVSNSTMRLCIALTALLWLAGCAPPPQKTPPQKIANSPDSAHGPIKIGGPVEGCKLVRYVRAVYPEELKKKRIQGIVTLRAIISKTGELREIQVLKGDPLFVPAALAAVRQWRYSPCLLNSEPVEVTTDELIDFTLTQ